MDYRTSDGVLKTYITKNAAITSGQSLSTVVDIEQLNIAGLLMPVGWDPADITFQVSPDGVTFGDVQNNSGTEVKITPAAGKFMGVSLPELSGVRYLKIRSGTSASAVNQTADRTIALVLTSNAEASVASTGGGAATIADGADVNAGSTTDAAIVADVNGTLSGKLRGVVKMLADIWDSTNHFFKMSIVAAVAGGYTPGKLISAASTNATNIKPSAGKLGYITASNINASPRYLKVYNKASIPSVGTDTPVHTFLIPGNTAGAGTNIPLPAQGIDLATGISIALTTGVADNDNSAVAANEIVVNYGIK